MSEIWRNGNGDPLAFQAGDYVEIDTTSRPDRAYTLPFLSGYVRGYTLSEGDGGSSVAYELFRMGENPLRWVREEFLVKAPEPIPHACPAGQQCGICGSGGMALDFSVFTGPKN